MPEFDLPTLGGGRFRSSDLAPTGPALLIFGSSTCPMTDNAAPGLNELYLRFGDRVRFVMVTTRGASRGGISAARNARRKNSTRGAATRPPRLRVRGGGDDVDGTLHRALGPKPNSAYSRSQRDDPIPRALGERHESLTAALNDLVGGESPFPSRSGGLVKPMQHMLGNIAPVLDRAGRGAWADMWRVAPPLAAIAFALKALGARPRKAHRPAPAMFRTAVDEALRINETALPDRNSCLRLRRLRDLVRRQ